MHTKIVLLLLALFLSLSTLARAEEGFKEGGKEVGQGFKKMGKATGKVAKKSGKAVGKGFEKAGKETGKAFKEMGKDVGKAVKEGGSDSRYNSQTLVDMLQLALGVEAGGKI